MLIPHLTLLPGEWSLQLPGRRVTVCNLYTATLKIRLNWPYTFRFFFWLACRLNEKNPTDSSSADIRICCRGHCILTADCSNTQTVSISDWLQALFSQRFSAPSIFQWKVIGQGGANRTTLWLNFDWFIRNWMKFAQCMGNFRVERNYSGIIVALLIMHSIFAPYSPHT